MKEMLWKFVDQFTLTQFIAVYNMKVILIRLYCIAFMKKLRRVDWNRDITFVDKWQEKQDII